MRFAIIFSLVLLSSAYAQAASPLKWLAFGDLRGHLEPCGCDPSTDLGGMNRLESVIRREVLKHDSQVRVFHLGNAYSLSPSEVAKAKNLAISSGLSLLNIDVSLLNKSELLAGAEMLPSIRYVLSNHNSKKTTVQAYKSVVVLDDAVVYGFVEPFKGYSGLEYFSSSYWQNKKKNDQIFKQARRSVLLYSGTSATLVKIAKARVFDEIIASNIYPFDKEFDDFERQNPALLDLKSPNARIRQVPLGGQGILRSPSLFDIPPAKPLALIVQGKTHEWTREPTALLKQGYEVVWLSKEEDTGSSESMADSFKKYRASTSSRMNELVITRSKDLETSQYVGSKSCESCHSKAFQVWSQSKHASAFMTIEKVSRTTDPECVSCHVVGFADKGGFVSKEVSPHLADVHCESCHGPRKEHLANPTAKVPFDSKKSCEACHTAPHSPKFNYDVYWKSIAH
jgi:hypothetical protein